jgi:hypothetical protein
VDAQEELFHRIFRQVASGRGWPNPPGHQPFPIVRLRAPARSRKDRQAAKPDFSLTKPYYETGRSFAEKPGFFKTAAGSYETTLTHNVARSGAAFLAEAQKLDQPFFLTLSFLAVHPPYDVPKPYNAMYDWRQVQLPVYTIRSRTSLHTRMT